MNNYLKHIALLIVLLAAAACVREETFPSDGHLYICASSLPFVEDGAPATKSINNGFLTTFEEGDRIGVTGVDKNGNVIDICNNVRFTFHSSEIRDGVIWSSFLNDRGYGFVEKVSGAKYFAYYPYDAKWDGKNLDYILSNFNVETDQSTKASFEASDLMTPDEAIVPENGELSFRMKHKMTTISLFYNNEYNPDGTPLYPIILFSGTTPEGLTIAHTYRSEISPSKFEHRRRYLVNPRTTPSVKLIGCLEEKSTRYFSSTLENLQEGYLYSVSFEGEPLVPYTDGVDLELDNVEFVDRFGNTVTLGHTVMWSKYNLGESLGESYPFAPLSGDRGTQKGSRDPYARGDYYSWGATFTQYDNGQSGYHGYGYNNYFDTEYHLAPLGGTIKETEYDVAHAKWWRGKWRLPTENEFRAMYAGCNFEKVDQYYESQNRYLGRPGSKRTFYVYKVTSKKNPEKFIYMTSSGYLDGTFEAERDSEGNITSSGDNKLNQGLVSPLVAYYMTSSASPTILRCVSYAYFNDREQHIKIDGSRYTGMLVRPVYSPNEYSE